MQKNKINFEKLLNQKAKTEDDKLALLKDLIIAMNKNFNRINLRIDVLIDYIAKLNIITDKDCEYRNKYERPILEKIIKKFLDK